MSIPLNKYDDPLFDRCRAIVRWFAFANFISLSLLLFLTNKMGLQWKFFWYEHQQLKFLFLMTFINYGFSLLLILYLYYAKEKFRIVEDYNARMDDLKNKKVDVTFFDAAGSAFGYSPVRGFLIGNFVFLLTPIIFGLLFLVTSFYGTLFVLALTFIAQWYLIPVSIALWAFILWRIKDV